MNKILFSLLLAVIFQHYVYAETVRVATFNVSMEASNYQPQGASEHSGEVLLTLLESGEHPQIRNIAEIIQRVAPDIILLNEFDYYPNSIPTAAALFVRNYLNKSQQGQQAIDYPYQFTAPVNTGVASPFDLDNNGEKTGNAGDAYGWGMYPGQYGMALLSRYPIDVAAVRTFQHFLWQDMPGALQITQPNSGEPWFTPQEWAAVRLSSKSHWDIPLTINGKKLHILAMHPTPPTFDGPEDRNGKRNHDEIRLMADYLSPERADYIYDDKGNKGGFDGQRFVLAGDFNAADIGDKYRPGVIEQLTEHPLVNSSVIPQSDGGSESAEQPYSSRFTAYWGARADYVLPSRKGLTVQGGGVFWPVKASPLYRLVKDRQSSSDHRLVWMDIVLDED
ncbi:MAG: endonuclease [Alteromonadaceae bacterium]|nr:endonuclease [Alteromonadaceae bacterium]|tara:strand:- start:203 stop:1378 length:1176 start_codon:yes stop_codon:yes gene_type:complete